MNITQYKDGNKSVKTLSLSELVETMKDPAYCAGEFVLCEGNRVIFLHLVICL